MVERERRTLGQIHVAGSIVGRWVQSEMLKWAMRNGCPFGIYEMRGSASSRHFGVLKLMYKVMMVSKPLVANEWDPSFCAETARSGNTRGTNGDMRVCWNGEERMVC